MTDTETPDTETFSMWQLEKDIRIEVRDEAQYLLDSKYPDDMIHEMADSHVPVYTTVLMNLAASDIGLATDEPEIGPAFDGSPTPVNIITANVYERLWAAANAEWADIQSETEDCDECSVSLLTDNQIVDHLGLIKCAECAEVKK